MKEWFAGLSPRERLMVIAATAVIVVGLLYLTLWKPLNKGVDELNRRVAGESHLVAWMQGVSEQARQLRAKATGRVSGSNRSLLAVIDSTSRKAGLGDAVQRIQPQGNDRAQITLSGAGFNKMLHWLRNLEQHYNVVVTALSVTRNDTGNTVDSRMTLKRTVK